MPAKDIFHDSVKNALESVWKVLGKPPEHETDHSEIKHCLTSVR